MLQMPYPHGVDVVSRTTGKAAPVGWRARLPELRGTGVTLRELRASDAASLHARLTTEQVARFISPPPRSVEAFADFGDQFVMLPNPMYGSWERNPVE